MAEDRRGSSEERGRRENKGNMTVQEAGRRGGEKTAATHGREFYEEIGHKGGQRVRELIEQGKRAQGVDPETRSRSSRSASSSTAGTSERGAGAERRA